MLQHSKTTKTLFTLNTSLYPLGGLLRNPTSYLKCPRGGAERTTRG